ncbi:MAG TPA: TIGR02647 family protein [Pseudomonadales bacterium]|nr:TIGR02647 family protein [Pseudomonadales bacterium]
MPYSPDIIEELEILSLFDLSSTQSGIKIHKSAMKTEVEAAKRLHRKGLITQADGGYLTTLGLEAAEHAESLCRILQAEKSN